MNQHFWKGDLECTSRGYFVIHCHADMCILKAMWSKEHTMSHSFEALQSDWQRTLKHRTRQFTPCFGRDTCFPSNAALKCTTSRLSTHSIPLKCCTNSSLNCTWFSFIWTTIMIKHKQHSRRTLKHRTQQFTPLYLERCTLNAHRNHHWTQPCEIKKS